MGERYARSRISMPKRIETKRTIAAMCIDTPPDGKYLAGTQFIWSMNRNRLVLWWMHLLCACCEIFPMVRAPFMERVQPGRDYGGTDDDLGESMIVFHDLGEIAATESLPPTPASIPPPRSTPNPCRPRRHECGLRRTFWH